MKIPSSNSIFVKLLAVYGLAFILVSAGAATLRYISLSSINLEVSIDNVRRYAAGLAAEIGAPPDLSRARTVADETGLVITISGNQLNWISDVDYEKEERWPAEIDEPLHFFLAQERDREITVSLDSYNYSFSEFHSDYRATALSWAIMAGSVMAALMLSYFSVRHLLKPIRVMNKVALEFGVSHWKQRVNPEGNDELATLGRAMDNMAERIEEYIRSMQELLVGVSHELRTPLTRMKVALEFIDNLRIRESLDEEIRSLDRLTGDLLEQKRLTSQQNILRLERIAVQEWIRSQSESLPGGGQPPVLELKGPEKEVDLDRGRMEMIIRNLLENARRHADGDGVCIHLDTTRAGSGFSLEVSDRGPGMPEGMILRIGEPFLLGDPSRTGKRNGGGFGLGLSIVKAAAEAHGAVFTARNIKPAGFSVRLDFPEEQAQPPKDV